MKFYLLLLILFSYGCTTAKLSRFPTSASAVDFESISKSPLPIEKAIWRSKTRFDFYLKSIETNKRLINQAILAALKNNGYKVFRTDTVGNVLLARRGLRANEWNAIAGIYYQIQNEAVNLYIKTEITQDFTGSWLTTGYKKLEK